MMRRPRNKRGVHRPSGKSRTRVSVMRIPRLGTCARVPAIAIPAVTAAARSAWPQNLTHLILSQHPDGSLAHESEHPRRGDTRP